jgi:hypothetical protein
MNKLPWNVNLFAKFINGVLHVQAKFYEHFHKESYFNWFNITFEMVKIK